MYYITLKLPKSKISSYQDALQAIPSLDGMPIHKDLDSAVTYINEHDRHGLVYGVEVNDGAIYHDANLNHEAIRTWDISDIKQIHVLNHGIQKLCPTKDENTLSLLSLLSLLKKIQASIRRIPQTDSAHDVTLDDYFTHLCCLIDEIRHEDPCSNSSLIRSLEILEDYLKGQHSYPDYILGIKELGLPSSLDRLMRIMAVSLLTLSLIICPSLLFAEVLSSILVLNVMAISAMIGAGILFFPGPRQEYETSLTNIAKTDASIREELSRLKCDLPPASCWR